MKKLTVYLFVFVVMPFSVLASDRFFSGLYDVPVLSNLEAVPELSYTYDTASGKIAHAAAVVEGSPDQIYTAYGEVLPRFGWISIGKHAYRRDGEILSVSHESLDKSWLFHFTLRPEGENSHK